MLIDIYEMDIYEKYNLNKKPVKQECFKSYWI